MVMLWAYTRIIIDGSTTARFHHLLQRQVSDTSEKLNNWSPLNEDFHSNNYQAKHAKRVHY